MYETNVLPAKEGDMGISAGACSGSCGWTMTDPFSRFISLMVMLSPTLNVFSDLATTLKDGRNNQLLKLNSLHAPSQNSFCRYDWEKFTNSWTKTYFKNATMTSWQAHCSSKITNLNRIDSTNLCEANSNYTKKILKKCMQVVTLIAMHLC